MLHLYSFLNKLNPKIPKFAAETICYNKPMTPQELDVNEVLDRRLNVTTTRDELGVATTTLEKVGSETSRVAVSFGKDGQRYGVILSDKITISGIDASVQSASKEHLLALTEGAPSEQEVALSEQSVGRISAIMVREYGADEGMYNLLSRVNNKTEVTEHLKHLGVHMARAEEGVLGHVTDYVFTVGDGAEAVVNIGGNKYVEAKGTAMLRISRGDVFMRTQHEGKTAEVMVHIKPQSLNK